MLYLLRRIQPLKVIGAVGVSLAVYFLVSGLNISTPMLIAIGTGTAVIIKDMVGL